MSDTLIDISVNSIAIENSFGKLHEDLRKFVLHREDKLSVETVLIIKFIVHCYDKESDITQMYKSRWAEKKKEAAVAAGLIEEGKLIEGAEEIIYAKNRHVNAAIVRYVSLQSDKDFLEYAVYQEMLIKTTGQLLDFKFDRPSDQSKAKDNQKALKRDLEHLERDIFSGGDVRELTKALQEHVRKFVVSDLRPERIVSRAEKGEELVDDAPYGEEYKPTNGHFVDDK